MNAPRRTVISRKALSSLRWQPTSLFASAAITASADRRQRRRRAAPSDIGHPEFLTIMQTAHLLGLGRTTIYKLLNQGQLHRVPWDERCARIARTELYEFIEARTAAARRQPDG